MKQRLVVGLGNPGIEYALTRHNIGFLALDAFADKAQTSFKKESKLSGEVAKARVGDDTVYLLKPSTFMNLSGDAVSKVCAYYKIQPSDVLVITDDTSIDFGRRRLRERGSSGGHNGLKSIQSRLGTDAYWRLRLGVGYDKRFALHDYVLARFKPEEREELPKLIEGAIHVVDRWLVGDKESVLRFANTPQSKKKKTTPPSPTKEREED